MKGYIVEDDIDNIELLKLFIKKCRNDIEIIGEATNTNQLNDLLLLNKADVIFLDIELENRKISLDVLAGYNNIKSEIIITSSSEKYALRALNEHKISSYILKPIKVSILDKAIHKVAVTVSQKIKFPTFIYNGNLIENFTDQAGIEKIETLNIHAIIYLEAHGECTKFHLTDGSSKIVSKEISSYLDILPVNIFFRVGDNYIIYSGETKIIHKNDADYCLLKNDTLLPISKQYIEEFRKLLHAE
jgi:two-component system LytT family response regulator